MTNLAGRLRTRHLYPLTVEEIPTFELQQRLQFGCLPPVFFSEDPHVELKDYCGEYLKEEVRAEGLVRNLPAFSRFLELSALSNGEVLSFVTIARDCGVSQKTVKEYFQVLVDTLIGFYLDPFVRARKRRAILKPKFYFFDCGIPNTLLDRRLSPKTPEYGKAFEQFMVLEAIAAKEYGRKFEKLTFWRSASGYEVDLIIDDHTAVEFKTGKIHPQDSKGLFALQDEIKLKNKWIVGLEERPRKMDSGVWVLPWKDFSQRMNDGVWIP